MCPIKGLSEARRLPRLGKIHLGIKKTKLVEGREVEYPSAVDYFVCPTEVQAVFGEKPKELRVMIPVEDEERWASQYYRCYSQTRGLVCRGDGETCSRMIDTDTGALANRNSKNTDWREDLPCEGRDCPEYEKQCREIMNLQFLIPEVPGLGIWQIDTSSINSIRNINSATFLLRGIYRRISFIPLLLTIEPQEVQDTEGHKRIVHVLNLRTNQTLMQMTDAIDRQVKLLSFKGDMPKPDDEIPEMIIPQVQEEKVTAPLPAEEKPAAAKPRTERKAAPKEKPATAAPNPETGQAGPTDPETSQEEKQKLVVVMRERGKTDQDIRETFQRITGKKGGWRKSDVEKMWQELNRQEEKAAAPPAEDKPATEKSSEEKAAEKEANDFLKTFGS